ncbi:unnamed protein product [Didymodactylos carnosus]|uniref:Uncharacterized protein n=1 Tax=Didymodactylos carnosus TaxID=1234261 RepID=A0A8S2Q6J2_9BILA|nr:unnamed protein product [Didymodactylos carnosus]CAF4080816.1 unnamed protein product [Didymodactylos carnosus]
MITIMFVYTTTTNEQLPQERELLKILSGRAIRFVSKSCELKYENCLLDVNDADKLNTLCPIYSRLRDCLLILNQDITCSSIHLKRQLQKMRQQEYKACGVSSMLSNIGISSSASSSSSSFILFSTINFYSISFVRLYSMLILITFIYFIVYIIDFCDKKISYTLHV